MNKKFKFTVINVILFVLTLSLAINSYAVEVKNISKLYFKSIIPGITLEKDVLDTFKNVIKKTINSDNTYSYYFSNSKKENLFEIVTLTPEGKVIYTNISSDNLQLKNINEVKNIIGESKAKQNNHSINNILVKSFNSENETAIYHEYGVMFIYSKATGNINRACYFEKCNSITENECYVKMIQNVQL